MKESSRELLVDKTAVKYDTVICYRNEIYLCETIPRCQNCVRTNDLEIETEPAGVVDAMKRKKFLLYLLCQFSYKIQFLVSNCSNIGLCCVVLHTFISFFFALLWGVFLCMLSKAINLLFLYCMEY